MIRTAESVSPMHPDKICDRISDAILDELLRQDPNCRVGVEAMGGHGVIVVTGEVTTSGYVNVRQVVQNLLGGKYGVHINIVEQSAEIASGVDTGGAGDQGIMVGYATNETPELMPREVMLARQLNRHIFEKHGSKSDGKTQVTYDTKTGELLAVVASFQNVSKDVLKKDITDWAGSKRLKLKTSGIYCNPAGDWHIGGFEADTGLTGRKQVVDNYGPRIPVGGGCFSGKDPTKVDRSAAYMARRVAVDYLRKHNAQEVFSYLAYAIGKSEPLQATVIVDGQEMVIEGYDLTPKGIIDFLDLRKPQYEITARYGHFGNGFTWDK
ncbi:methionine adenosyltransferase domain-containing protein [Candidatus Uhrbacteria bacterium]|nr:methionine adenosyltransferase domain-containing protein [Candidatus Doudnabacteria bacterium]MBI4276214.1 methionine adenosyltransferase domain-containing protein [Candidatus Uhrbacteria bacterium]